MKSRSIKSHITRTTILLFTIIAFVLMVGLGFSLFYSESARQEQQGNLWLKSFRETLLPLIIESDYAGVSRNVEVLLATEIFDHLKIVDLGGNTVFSFGTASSVLNYIPLEDESGELWGSCTYSFSRQFLIDRILDIVFPTFLITILVLFAASWFSYLSLDRLVQPIIELSDHVIKISKKIENSDERTKFNQTSMCAISGDEISESRYILSSFCTLLDTVEQYQGRALEFQTALVRSEVSKAKMDSIVKTAQMLAHDLKKPFAMLRLFEKLISNTNTPEVITKVTESFKSEYLPGIEAAEQMIKNLSKIKDGDSKLDLSFTKLESFIARVVKEVDSLRDDHNIEIIQNFDKDFEVYIDQNSIRRVIDNILSNALGAMVQGGKIWIGVSHETTTRTWVTIKNSGSCIPQNLLVSIFDPFVTIGKKGGTGLGLTIARKYLSYHECEILARSWSNDEGDWTEFRFSLPKFNIIIPSSENQEDETFVVDKNTISSTDFNATLHYLKDLKRPLELLILDDHVLYREMIEKIIQSNHELSNLIKIIHFGRAKEALNYTKSHQVDVQIVDIDLGRSEPSGLEYVDWLLNEGYESIICFHSDINFDDIKNITTNPKVELFFPKPLSLANLLKIINLYFNFIPKVIK